MKPFLRAFWPRGYFFLIFCAALIGGVWLFKGIVSHAPFPHFGAGAIIGAIWAWFMCAMAKAATESGKEFAEALKRESTDGVDHETS